MGTAIAGDVDLETHYAYAPEKASSEEPPVEVEQLLQRGSA